MGSPVDSLTPKGLALAGLIAPLVLLYILKVRRKRKRVASTWLWASAQRDLIARSPWKKLIAQVPLVLELLALVLLALALARPATRGRALTGDHVAIIVDASASMSAESTSRDKTTTRMELAQEGRVRHPLVARAGQRRARARGGPRGARRGAARSRRASA